MLTSEVLEAIERRTIRYELLPDPDLKDDLGSLIKEARFLQDIAATILEAVGLEYEENALMMLTGIAEDIRSAITTGTQGTN